MASQGEGLSLRPHDRLFGKDRIAGLEGGQQMPQVQVIGRADHHQIERPIGQQGLGIGEGAARPDAPLGQDRQAHGRGVHMPRHLKIPAHVAHGAQHMGDALTQPDDGDAVTLHGPSIAPSGRSTSRRR